jgi:Obg family GTPase CgtA-like protein
LLEATEATLREAREQAVAKPKPQARRVYRLDEDAERAFTVTRTGEDRFQVTGIAIERLTKMTNFDQLDAIERYQRVLDRSGISAELERLGVEPGDTVTIAGRELTWGEEFELPDLGNRRTAKERRFGPQSGGDELVEVFDLDAEDYDPEDEELDDDDE